MAQRICSIEGCGNAHSGRGWCGAHYQRWFRYGDPLGVGSIHIRGRICSFDGCGKPHSAHGYCTGHATQRAKGQELRPLHPSWKGIECTAEADCHEPVIARGYCRKHWQRWRKHGDPTRVDQPRRDWRKYALNEAYFDEITTEEQAYWLGFITADGCVHDSGGNHQLAVMLSALDSAHLERMRADLGSARPLTFERTGVNLRVDSRHLVGSLIRLGVTPRKSATAQPWDGPPDLMRHYWRGMFDGDGSIYQTSRDGVWNLSLCGSEACVKAFAEWACGICGSRATPVHVRGGCWAWNVGGSRKPQALAAALYVNATVSLLRKQERADKLCATDFDAATRTSGLRRAAAMRELWASGRFASRTNGRKATREVM